MQDSHEGGVCANSPLYRENFTPNGQPCVKKKNTTNWFEPVITRRDGLIRPDGVCSCFLFRSFSHQHLKIQRAHHAPQITRTSTLDQTPHYMADKLKQKPSAPANIDGKHTLHALPNRRSHTPGKTRVEKYSVRSAIQHRHQIFRR